MLGEPHFDSGIAGVALQLGEITGPSHEALNVSSQLELRGDGSRGLALDVLAVSHLKTVLGDAGPRGSAASGLPHAQAVLPVFRQLS